MNETSTLNLDEDLCCLQKPSATESFFALLRHGFFGSLTGMLAQRVPDFLDQDSQIKQFHSPRIGPGNVALGCDTPKQSHPPTGFIDLRGCCIDNPNHLLRRWVVPKGKGSTMLNSETRIMISSDLVPRVWIILQHVSALQPSGPTSLYVMHKTMYKCMSSVKIDFKNYSG